MINSRIKDKKDCTGCHACSSICPQGCISMVADTEGLCYPKVNNDNCIKCGLCIKACPVINRIESNPKVKEEINAAVINRPEAYACINQDEDVRLDSSSGGIFTLIAEHVIDSGGVVFGVGFNEEYKAEHSFIVNKSDIGKFRGSKYVQSRIGDAYSQTGSFLNQGRKVLFTGTPCQISGLKSYLECYSRSYSESNLRESYNNLICMDNICHGVPSPKVWEKYVAIRETEAGSKTRRISFRCKDEGWKQFSVLFQFQNGTEYQATYNKDLYMRAFLKDIILRPSCYNCRFKTLYRQSDITLGDFWGIQNVIPEMDDDKGTSLVLVNSTTGSKMLEQINSKVICRNVDVNRVIKYNPAVIKSVKHKDGRKYFLNKIDKESFDILVKKYCADSIWEKIKEKAEMVIGIVLEKMGLLCLVKKALGRD